MAEKRLYSGERDALNALAVMADMVTQIADDLGDRLKITKNGKRNIGMLLYTVNDLLSNMFDTIPPKQLEAVARNLKSCSYTVGIKSPNRQGHNDEWGLWVSNNDLDTITAAAKAQCLTCDLCDGRERKCELRKALDNVGSDIEHDAGTGCGYRWM